MFSPNESSSIVLINYESLQIQAQRKNAVENSGKNKEKFAQQNRPWEFLPSPWNHTQTNQWRLISH